MFAHIGLMTSYDAYWSRVQTKMHTFCKKKSPQRPYRLWGVRFNFDMSSLFRTYSNQTSTSFFRIMSKVAEKKLINEKIAKVREVVHGVSTNDIILALHSFDMNVERTIQAFCEGNCTTSISRLKSIPQTTFKVEIVIISQANLLRKLSFM